MQEVEHFEGITVEFPYRLEPAWIGGIMIRY
jgi:hypothetical protein